MRRLNLADGEPFARGHGVVPGGRSARELSRADVERSPFYELLDVPLGGADADDRRRRGRAPRDADAARRSRPARRCCAASGSPPTLDGDAGAAVSEHVFPAHRTEFVVDLPSPTGLSLVE